MARIEGLGKAFKNINRKIAKAVNVNLKNDLTKLTEEYKAERRKGINPKTGKPYKALKQSTIDRRKKLAKANSTHPKYSSSKSNLTFTGQLIDSIRARFLLRPLLTFTLEVDGDHRPYTGIRKKKLGRSIPNKKIADGLAEQGRPLISTSKKLLNQIQKRLIKALKKSGL